MTIMNSLVAVQNSELSLTVEAVDNEPRILDTDLAVKLGFDRPRKIRELIERYMQELTTYGVCPAVGRTSGPQGGRPSTAYYLNEEQALLVCVLSDAPKAREARFQIISVFTAYRRGTLVPVAALALPDFSDAGVAARAWADEHDAKKRAEANALKLTAEKAAADTEIQRLEPLAEAAERLVLASGSMSFREAAKSIGISQKRLTDFLSSKKVLYKDPRGTSPDSWQPYAACHPRTGWFDVIRQVYGGTTKIQTKITPKGLVEIRMRLVNAGILSR